MLKIIGFSDPALQDADAPVVPAVERLHPVRGRQRRGHRERARAGAGHDARRPLRGLAGPVGRGGVLHRQHATRSSPSTCGSRRRRHGPRPARSWRPVASSCTRSSRTGPSSGRPARSWSRRGRYGRRGRWRPQCTPSGRRRRCPRGAGPRTRRPAARGSGASVVIHVTVPPGAGTVTLSALAICWASTAPRVRPRCVLDALAGLARRRRVPAT